MVHLKLTCVICQLLLNKAEGMGGHQETSEDYVENKTLLGNIFPYFPKYRDIRSVYSFCLKVEN